MSTILDLILTEIAPLDLPIDPENTTPELLRPLWLYSHADNRPIHASDVFDPIVIIMTVYTCMQFIRLSQELFAVLGACSLHTKLGSLLHPWTQPIPCITIPCNYIAYSK